MSWLRLDDGIDSNPKILELSEVQRWRWIRLLTMCAKHEMEGVVTDAMLREAGLFSLRERLVALRLLDRNSDALVVHDWDEYNGGHLTREELEARVCDELDADPTASANEIVRRVGGSRNKVLRLVKRYHAGTARGTDTGTRTGIAPVRNPGIARAHPVPSLEPVDGDDLVFRNSSPLSKDLRRSDEDMKLIGDAEHASARGGEGS